MASAQVERTVEHILAKPAPERMALLENLMHSTRKSTALTPRSSRADAMALDFNAQLITAVRRACELQRIAPPWATSKS